MTHTAQANASLQAVLDRHGDVPVLPTSLAQERFWVLDQVDPGSAIYTMPFARRLTGALDVAALRRALNALVARHEALRTVFALDAEGPVQVVLPALALDVPVVDLRALPADAREARVQALAAENGNAPFDLAAGPLVRASLVRAAHDEHVLLFAVHHIVCDGISMGVLFEELAALYAAERAGTDAALPDLPLQYGDYAVWQRRAVRGAVAGRQLAYWKTQLRDLPMLDLPTDKPRPAELTFRGSSRDVVIPAPLVEGVRALARKEGATPFMAFLAAYVALLHRHTAQDDVVVGVVTSGRRRAELERLVGLFVNTAAIRVPVRADASFSALLADVREAATAAFANEDVPFAEVVEAVQPPRDPSRASVFQAGFQLLDTAGGEMSLPGVTVSRVRWTKESAKTELTLTLHAEPGGGLRAVCEYVTDLFEPATIDRLLARYATLLGAIVRDPSAPVARLPIMPAAEYARVVDEWNATDAPAPDAALHELVAAQAARAPNAVAIAAYDDGGAARPLTYAALDALATAMAGRLQACGVTMGQGVGVCVERSPAYVVAALGALKAGAYWIPLAPDDPADRQADVLAQAGAAALVARPGVAVGDGTVPRIDLDAAFGALDDAPAPTPVAVGGDAVAYVLFTSGSTGRPKGVMVPHRGIVNYVAWVCRTYLAGADTTFFWRSPTTFDPSVFEVFAPLASGGTLAIGLGGEYGDPARFIDAARRSRATVLAVVPALLQLLLATPGFDALRDVQHVFCGGEALTRELLEATARALPQATFANMYGPTEASIAALRWDVSLSAVPAEPALPPIGRPLANVRAYVLDAAMQPVPIGVPGELYVAGRGVASGYVGRPDLTAERFGPDPVRGAEAGRAYRTGDWVRWNADGTIQFLGRIDHQVKIRGMRVELGEIESVLASVAGVRHGVVLLRENVPGDRRLVAYVVPADGAEPPPDAVLAALRARLPAHMIPDALVRLDALPLSASGKVDRRALPAPDDAWRAPREVVAPRTPLERQLADAWALVLRRDAVGVTDDFFDLGGHSLLAMRVVARLASALDVPVTISMLLEARTIERLAGAVEARRAERAAAEAAELGDLLGELESMSDDEVARLLAEADERGSNG